MSLSVARIKFPKNISRDVRKFREYKMATVRTIGTILTIVLQCATLYFLLRSLS